MRLGRKGVCDGLTLLLSNRNAPEYALLACFCRQFNGMMLMVGLEICRGQQLQAFYCFAQMSC